jgi:putative sigma-54 modulation protein
MERLLRLFDRLLSIDVTVDFTHREMPSVDVRVSAEHKHDFVATDQASSLSAALDGVVHKLEGQLRKYKERVQSRHRTPRSQSASLEAEGSGE